MIKKAKKHLKNSTLLLVIGVSLLLGCPSSGDQTTVFPITSSIPASGATNFSADGNIILTYNQAVIKGEGVITLLTYLPSVGKRVTIAIDDAQVSIAGNVVTIDPPIDLDMGISYILTIPAGVFLSAAGGNAIPADTLFFSTAPAIDITAPAISAAMSVGGATDLSANADIIVTFDEPVVKGSGEIILTPTVGAPITIAVSDPRVTVVGGVVTIDPMADLAVGTSYTLTIPAGAFIDASGNSSPPDTQSFMTAPALDTTPPMLSSSVPANNATDVAVGANIVLTYDEAVQKGSGSITLQPTGGTVVTIPISTAQVSVAGSVVTINPTTDLLAGTDYTLMVPAGVIDDLAGNSAGSLTLSFATAAALDTTPPTINSSAPASGATINAFDNIVLMYSEALQKGSGSITLQPSVGTLVTIPISSAQVSVVAGVVAIDPTADLVAGTSYTLSFPAGVFQDLAGNNAGSFTLNFNTAVPLDTTAPTISSRVPVTGGMLESTANIVLTYNEAVQKGSGSITLQPMGGTLVTIPISSTQVSVAGAVVTINPTADLTLTSYTLMVPAGAFQDLVGNSAGSFTLSFLAQATMIQTIADLENVRNNLDGDYVLAANIDLSSIDNWQPIGDEANRFTGSFDGQDYQISGLNSSGYQYAGLFGRVNGGSISNLGVLVGTISSSSTSSVSDAGGLVGEARGSSISNSYVIVVGNISSSSTSSVSRPSTAGGLVGYARGSSISNSYAEVEGNISSSSTSGDSDAGGLVGQAWPDSLISNSYAVVRGDISSSSSSSSQSSAGGLVGSAAQGSSISNSYAIVVGNISSSSVFASFAGGLVGRAAQGSSISNSYAVVGGSISSSSTSGASDAGGLVGSANGSPISNSYAVVRGNISSSSTSSTSFAGGLVGFTFSSSPISNSYAEVVGNISSSLAGGLVGSANGSPISNSYAVVRGNISSSSTSSTSFAGGLVGQADGTMISNSYAQVEGDISSSSGDTYAGGLVGRVRSGSSISNSYAVVGGDISSSSSGDTYAGGLVGDVASLNPISNSYTVVGGNISSSSSSGDSFAGGLVGGAGTDSSISNSYYSASRQSSEGNFDNTLGASQTVAQLRSLTATGTGWMAFFDASSAPAHAFITDTSATFATGDRRLWHFGDNAQLPLLNPSPAQVTASDLPLYRARQHFVATASSATQVNLSWSSAGATYTFYEVHRHTANDSSGATRVGSPQVSAVGRTYADTGLTTATTYYYWLKACAGSVCSDFFANTQTTTP